jgi:hypothetical protein
MARSSAYAVSRPAGQRVQARTRAGSGQNVGSGEPRRPYSPAPRTHIIGRGTDAGGCPAWRHRTACSLTRRASCGYVLPTLGIVCPESDQAVEAFDDRRDDSIVGQCALGFLACAVALSAGPGVQLAQLGGGLGSSSPQRRTARERPVVRVSSWTLTSPATANSALRATGHPAGPRPPSRTPAPAAIAGDAGRGRR